MSKSSKAKAAVAAAEDREVAGLPDDAEAAKPAAPKPAAAKPKAVAKRDFEIVQNGYHRVIKAGEDVSDVPIRFHENLRTERVL